MASHIERRKFLATLGGAVVAWPLAARAQQPGKLPTIGFLVSGTRSSHGQWVAAFVERLRELGWIEGRTVAIEYRFAQGREESYAEIFAEFVRRRVDVIVTSGAAILAAKQVASDIPVVFAAAVDPVSMGLVASLARPGGNITGLSLQGPDLAGKRLELLREVVSNLRRVAVLANTATPGAARELDEARAAARTLGLEAAALEIRRAEDIAPAIASVKGGADALYVCADPLVVVNRIRINILTLALRMPAIFTSREHVEAGGLMSYGPNFPDLYRRAAEHVDKILRGTRPGDIPVEQPTKFDFAVNLITANALGLTVPLSLLARADEVIE
jgi:putative tryptophan/tyrosine transport system substrate-binding protein